MLEAWAIMFSSDPISSSKVFFAMTYHLLQPATIRAHLNTIRIASKAETGLVACHQCFSGLPCIAACLAASHILDS
jgi:hypothetical protein